MKTLFLLFFLSLGLANAGLGSTSCLSNLSLAALKTIAEAVKGGQPPEEELSDDDKDALKGCLTSVFGREVKDDFFEKDLIELKQIIEDNKEVLVKTGKLKGGSTGNLLIGANLSDLDFSQVEVDFKDAFLAYATMQRLALVNADFGEANLDGADLSYADLTGANFSDASLKGANLDHTWLWDAKLLKTDFEGASLENANLWGASLDGVNFANASLQETNLSSAEIDGKTQFDNANLKGIILAGATIKGTEFRGTNLDKANLSGAYIANAKFINASLQASNLSGANLITTLFNKTSLNDVKGNNLLISKSTFQNNSSMYGADLSNSILSDISFPEKMDLQNSVMNKVHAHGTVFMGANLLNASFQKAMLKKADFSEANLYGADFSGANIEGAKFEGADLRTVIIDKDTKYQGAKQAGDKIIDIEWLKSQSVKLK